MTIQERLEFVHTPLWFYLYRRHDGYFPRNAAISVIMWFSPSGKDAHRRFKRIGKVLNKIDKGAYHGN